MNVAIGGIDAAILAAYLAGVVALGIWIGRGQRDAATYLLGGRDLPWWGLLLSIVATETSSVTFLSIPGMAFDPRGGSLVFLQMTLGYILGRFVVVGLFLPHYFRGDLFTAYEVLDRRFGGATKQAASLLFLVTRNLGDGLRLYLTALVLQCVLGMNLWSAVALVGATTILYTVLGGMKSVVWNDCVQFAIYIAGGLAALGVILAYLGSDGSGAASFANLANGWQRLTEFAQAEGKFRLLDLSLDPRTPYTLWSGVLGGIFVALATHGTDQLMVQRYLSARSQKEASWALGLSGFVVAAQFALFLLIGVGLACFYQQFDTARSFAKSDEVFQAFIVDRMPVGLVGLLVAAVLSASMSTLSSSLNSSATAALNDFYLAGKEQKPPQERLLRVSRVLTIAFGLVQVGVALVGPYLWATVVESVMAIAGFVSGVVLGVFFLGVLTRRVGQRGALVGLVGGLAAMSTMVILIPAATGITLLAWPWYAIVGSTITFAIGHLPGDERGASSHFKSPLAYCVPSRMNRRSVGLV